MNAPLAVGGFCKSGPTWPILLPRRERAVIGGTEAVTLEHPRLEIVLRAVFLPNSHVCRAV